MPIYCHNTQIDVATLVDAIDDAADFLVRHVIRTPTIRLPWLDTPDHEVWAKLESQQHSGSFKYRGALNALHRSAFESVITASGGNHALAVAAAGRKLGKFVTIIAPTTASELKISRLIQDAQVTLLGQDLYEAMQAAMRIAEASPKDPKTGLYFVSPYANSDVVAGAGTVMREATEDAGIFFNQVIVPLGGGGLAAAVAAWCVVKSPTTEVFCTYPEIFGRKFSSEHVTSKQLHVPVSATYSDGLGIRLVEQIPFASILNEHIHPVIHVSESETAAAIALVLRLQSLLIEGSAATTVGALINDESRFHGIKGRVLLIFSGGNVSSSTVVASLVIEVSDPLVRQKSGLRHIVNVVEQYGSVNSKSVRYHDSNTSNMKPKAQFTTIDAWYKLIECFKEVNQDLHIRYKQKEILSDYLGFETDTWSVQVFNIMRQFLVKWTSELKTSCEQSNGLVPLEQWIIGERYRVLIQLQATLDSMFDRTNASYDQSQRDWFFDVAARNSTSVNYARYGSSNLRVAEQRFIELLDLGQA